MIRVSTLRPVLLATFALVVMLSSNTANARQDVLTPEIAVSLKRVTQSAADPTGRYVAYVLSVPRVADDEPGGSYSQIWVSTMSGDETRRFTPEKGNSSSPQWSPDGKTIAFLSMRKGQNEHRQIYLLPVNGGEARMLTEHETAVSSFQWSPDGQSIAYASQEAKA
ncbi:MAG: PD40 domain-containing protein, partial [Planctomycetes bacterium]|nr:PD40 domain-containing protein [Planctomycetota bacterium]